MNHYPEYSHYQDLIQTALLDRLRRAEIPSKTLLQAMEYSLSNRGKYLRPMMVFIAGESLGSSTDTCLPPALAVELIHTYSLIHDDLPAMDNDDFRRGRPSLHKAFDEATAILAGDAMQSMAFQCLTDAHSLTPTQRLQMIKTLAHVSGPLGMASGQALDLAAGKEPLMTKNELEIIHAHKTGALIRGSFKLGALTQTDCDPDVLATLDQFAHALGIAFQIQDDILDANESQHPINPKITYISALGLTVAEQALEQWRELALQHLNKLTFDTSRLLAFTHTILTKH